MVSTRRKLYTRRAKLLARAKQRAVEKAQAEHDRIMADVKGEPKQSIRILRAQEALNDVYGNVYRKYSKRIKAKYPNNSKNGTIRRNGNSSSTLRRTAIPINVAREIQQLPTSGEQLDESQSPMRSNRLINVYG
jgi:hypothetical protein